MPAETIQNRFVILNYKLSYNVPRILTFWWGFLVFLQTLNFQNLARAVLTLCKEKNKPFAGRAENYRNQKY